MIELDCQSRHSALESVSVIYGVPPSDIEGFLRETDLDDHYERLKPPRMADAEITRLFEQSFKRHPAPLQRVFWFHLTRARAGSDFRNGLLPLDDALPELWQTILTVFRGTTYESGLRLLKENGVPNHHYCLKVGQPLHGGPYGMLVRETAFRSDEMGNHDYLWLPEIMEDICNGYHQVYGERIDEQLCNALTPYIVKFWSTKRLGRDCIESAMYYLYLTAHSQELSIGANTCFDGENSCVAATQIVKVEAVGLPSHG